MKEAIIRTIYHKCNGEIIKRALLPISVLILIFYFLSCVKNQEENNTSQSAVVAQIGNEIITAQEFRRSYETGFGHLKVGKDRKQTYLDFMINEKLLALEGYRLNLDESQLVKVREKKLLNELMIEALIEKEIKSKIDVKPEEIRKEINKSKVSFKLRYWPEPTLKNAREIAEDMRKRGYAAVVGDRLHQNRERAIDPAQFETDYLSYLDVPPEVLEAIKDLPYGKISDPVALHGKFFVFQILDIRRKALTENEYKANASRFEQIIFYRKLKNKLDRYIESLMEPKNVVTKAESFQLLGNAVQAWSDSAKNKDLNFVEAVKQATKQTPALLALKENLDKTFLTYNEGTLSLNDFLPFLDVKRLLKRSGKNTFREDLHFAVKTSIRDYFMAKEAASQNLENSPEVEKELKMWRDKWVFRETWDRLTGDVKIDEDQVKSYFERHRELYRIPNGGNEPVHFSRVSRQVWQDVYREQVLSTVEAKIKLLKQRYPVTINYAVLDTISVVDFRKSPWASFQIFKSGTNRPAFPSVEPVWAAGP